MSLRPVPSWPGIAADEQGIVYRDGVWAFERINTYGYVMVRPRPGQQRTRASLVCEAFHGLKPADKDVCAHRNDVKTDDRPENLYWATFRENVRDAIRNGHHSPPPIGLSPGAIGERNAHAKLNNAAVLAIREAYATGKFTHRQLAAKYGVAHSRIGEVLRGTSWKHVPLSVAT